MGNNTDNHNKVKTQAQEYNTIRLSAVEAITH